MILAYASYGHSIFSMVERALIYSTVWRLVRGLPMPVVLLIVIAVIGGGWLWARSTS